MCTTRGPQGARGVSKAAHKRRNLPWSLVRLTRVSFLNICHAQMTQSHPAMNYPFIPTSPPLSPWQRGTQQLIVEAGRKDMSKNEKEEEQD